MAKKCPEHLTEVGKDIAKDNANILWIYCPCKEDWVRTDEWYERGIDYDCEAAQVWAEEARCRMKDGYDVRASGKSSSEKIYEKALRFWAMKKGNLWPEETIGATVEDLLNLAAIDLDRLKDEMKDPDKAKEYTLTIMKPWKRISFGDVDGLTNFIEGLGRGVKASVDYLASTDKEALNKTVDDTGDFLKNFKEGTCDHCPPEDDKEGDPSGPGCGKSLMREMTGSLQYLAANEEPSEEGLPKDESPNVDHEMMNYLRGKTPDEPKFDPDNH